MSRGRGRTPSTALPGAVAGAAALALSAGSARADERDPVDPALGEVIVITGLKLPRPVRDVPSTVTVVDRAELARSPLVLADDVLRAVPSVGTFRRSSSLVADPTSQGLNLRGVGPSGVSRALVLLDGIPANDPFGGWVYWRSLSPMAIDRVEVVPGGASAVYGDFAMGGVVQMISRPIERRSLEVVLAGGSLGTARSSLRVTERRGKIGAALEGELFRSGGYAPIAAPQRGPIDHAARSHHGAASLRAEYDAERSRLHLTARAFDQDLDAGTDHTTAGARTATLGIGWRWRDAVTVEVFGGDQLFRQTRARAAPDRSSATLASSQRTPSRNLGAAVAWTLRPSEGHAVVVGADGRLVTGTATDSLLTMSTDPDALIERSAGGTQRLAGVFVEDAFHAAPWLEIVSALRLDAWHNASGSRTNTTMSGSTTRELDDTSARQFDPRVGVLARVTPIVSVRASGYRAFRAPTLNELYRPFQVGTILTEANERLRPETLWGAEAGLEVIPGEVMVRATGFWNRIDDAIANVTLAMPIDGAQRQRQNLSRARIAGLELDASWRPSTRWRATVAHTFSHGVIVEAPGQPDLIDKRLAQSPRLRATAAVAFDEPRWISATVQARYLGPQFEDDLNTRPIGSVVLVDAHVARRIGGGVAAFLNVQNAFDRRYVVGRAGVDTEGAPRTIEVGVQLAR